MVDVAHHGDDRCTRHQFVLGLGDVLFLEEGVRVVELGREGLVAHFLDEDHGRFLVELLVDGHHLAELHQLLDDLRRLHAHLVREVGDADRFGTCTSCTCCSAGATKVDCELSPRSPRPPVRRPPGARQPGRAPAPAGPSVRGLRPRFLASSAQLEDSFSDLTDFLSPAWPRCGRGCAGCGSRLVDGALDLFPGFRFGGSSGFFATITFFGAFIIARMPALRLRRPCGAWPDRLRAAFPRRRRRPP